MMRRSSSVKSLLNDNSKESISQSLLLHQQQKEINRGKIEKMIRKLYVYPIGAIIIWSVATISRTYELIIYDINDSGTNVNLLENIRVILYTLQVIVMSSRGIIYSFLYFMRYEKIRVEVKAVWVNIKDCFCCVKDARKKISGESYYSDL